ncbi:hypothetical protein [Streptacidiphilus anmyonensis]|uniref:hypothetical protein n=1 Tax=Streptacidiphilus anmyonensis TaxID=405782 RepID=UPI000AE9289C|nr:hypothetical protein [Streptacidiphilus anmyonensis]
MIVVVLSVLLVPLFVLLGWMTVESWAARRRARPAAQPVPPAGEPLHVQERPAPSTAG